MACFLAPMTEAIATTIVQKVVEKKAGTAGGDAAGKPASPWGRRLGWLNKMLWGGSILLAFEHLWHGEIVPWPPFLTAMSDPAEVGPMLREIATVGTAMAVTITVVWALMILVAELRARSLQRTGPLSTAGGNE